MNQVSLSKIICNLQFVYTFECNQQSSAAAGSKGAVGASTAKLLQQPSISITPLPRQQPPPPTPTPSPPVNKPGRPAGNSKATFVICEICDGYIKVPSLILATRSVQTVFYFQLNNKPYFIIYFTVYIIHFNFMVTQNCHLCQNTNQSNYTTLTSYWIETIKKKMI